MLVVKEPGGKLSNDNKRNSCAARIKTSVMSLVVSVKITHIRKNGSSVRTFGSKRGRTAHNS